MTRYLFFILFFFGIQFVSMAQMSDSQVFEFITRQTASGVSQSQIAHDLISRGVTLQQIQQVKSKYTLGYRTQSSDLSEKERVDRMRSHNGESFDEIMESMGNGDKGSDERSRIFGHDIFRSKILSFEPNMNIPVPSDYLLGPGDAVILDIFGATNQSSEMTISPDGVINIPNEGPVNIAGLTLAAAQKKVIRSIGGHYEGSEIKLTVGQTRTIIVNVLGEVKVPGTYTVSAFSTVFNALYLSGGVNEIGTMRDIQVSRGGKVISHIDIYDFILNGNLSGNIILQDNDAIRVNSYQNIVEIGGKVRRPMLYEMKEGETLLDLVNYAGGFTGDAYRDRIRVERESEDGLTVHNIARRDLNTFLPMDGDVAIIGNTIQRYKNTVMVDGAVFRPGKYKLGDDVTTVTELIELAGGLLEKAVTSRAVVYRMKEDRTLETHSLALGDILNGTAEDMQLMNEDRLFIGSTEILDGLKILTIKGEVVKPGEYTYSADESVEDLIIRAGGLLESASIDHVEIARRQTDPKDNPDGKTMARIIRVPLKKNLEYDGEKSVTLEPYDVVTILKSPDYEEQKTITITGEVKFAGEYTLSRKDERLSDLIHRAGGLTPTADAGGIKLTRRFSKEDTEMRVLQYETATNAADSAKALSELQKKSYHIGVDLVEILKNPGCSSDIVLEEGDEIYVPVLSNTVTISGNVLFKNTVAYVEGKSVSYYLNQAGGVSKTGRRGQTYIIFANGQVSKASSAKPQPGCEIVVPAKIKKELNPQTTALWLGLGSTLASIAAVVATILK